MNRPIADYAIIGDTHTTALLASDGSIDWLCWPRHDSPALFTKLLDDAGGGAFTFYLMKGAATGRRYLGETNILETSFDSPEGQATLTDFMPLFPPDPLADEGADGDSQSRLVRLVSCTGGAVSAVFRVRPTPDYGRASVAIRFCGDQVELEGGGLTLSLASSHPIEQNPEGLQITLALTAGQSAFVALTCKGPNEVAPIGAIEAAQDGLQRTRSYWEAWSRRSTYQGRYREPVMRSALLLKMLTYSPTGGIVAAPTTSLPEAVPGNRNFDYRYSWVRDASFTVTAFCNLGYAREAAEYLRFLRGADPSNGEDLKILYGLEGPAPPEEELANLPGWRGIGPVRIGNAARGQQQYDIYGEYLLALHTYLQTVDFDPPQAVREGLTALITNLANQADAHRDDPDSGIWELRGDDKPLQHTKALLWVALDRAAKLADRLAGFAEGDAARWRSSAARLRTEYETASWNSDLQAYTQSYGSDVLDAAVLRTILFGALDPRAPRTVLTLKAVEQSLTKDDLVYRYRADDGFEGAEGAFTACGFWRVGASALAGQTAQAQSLFERLLRRGNDLGLFAEEIDGESGEQRGNFPQGFTHMAIINHAVRLEAAMGACADVCEASAGPDPTG